MNSEKLFVIQLADNMTVINTVRALQPGQSHTIPVQMPDDVWYTSILGWEVSFKHLAIVRCFVLAFKLSQQENLHGVRIRIALADENSVNVINITFSK